MLKHLNIFIYYKCRNHFLFVSVDILLHGFDKRSWIWSILNN